MSERIKVMNDYGLDIHLNFKNLTNRIVTVLPHSFSYITEDELLFLTNSSKIIQSGLLTVDDKGQDLDDVKDATVEENVFTQKQIDELLQFTVGDIKEWIANTTNKLGLEKLLEAAKANNKAKGYIEAVEAKIEELS